MHRSRIGIFLIDHPESSHDASLAFWGGVVGREPQVESDDPDYAAITQLGSLGSIRLEGQRVGEGTAPRIHLDIESDDVEAEVARVEALGATVVERRQGYVIMNDPGGLVFCVVGIQTGEHFEREATTWP